MPGAEIDNRQYSDGQYIYNPWFVEAHSLVWGALSNEASISTSKVQYSTR